MNKFTVNGVTYVARPFDFNLLCDLEDMGSSANNLGNNTMSTARTYFALCSGLDKVSAGAELQAHIIKGGNFAELIDVMLKEMDESDFFQAMTKNEEEVSLEKEPKKTKKVQ